jgi:anti-sigma28 factor (negative regulator of flagellin synthesis)
MAVGMRDTSRHLVHRRSTAPAPAPQAHLVEHVSTWSGARVEALRKLVAAGQYHVSAKWLAHRVFRCAGIPVDE